jgi:hypothetical protein
LQRPLQGPLKAFKRPCKGLLKAFRRPLGGHLTTCRRSSKALGGFIKVFEGLDEAFKMAFRDH